jgi:hypothetical protein
VLRAVRARRADGDGPVPALEAGLRAAGFPRVLAAILTGELVAIALALTGWFRRPRPGFSMHRRKNWMMIVGLLMLIMIGGTVGDHLIVSHWSSIAAWVVTGLTLYGALWLLGDAHALRLYPLRLHGDELLIEIGLRWRVRLPRAAIVRITPCESVPEDALRAVILEPTALIELAAPVTVGGPFGIQRRADRIAITVDDVDGFIAAVGQGMR